MAKISYETETFEREIEGWKEKGLISTLSFEEGIKVTPQSPYGQRERSCQQLRVVSKNITSGLCSPEKYATDVFMGKTKESESDFSKVYSAVVEDKDRLEAQHQAAINIFETIYLAQKRVEAREA